MEKIKLVGFQTFLSKKDNKKKANIKFIILDEPMRCSDGQACGGFNVGECTIDDAGVPLHVNGEYLTKVKFGTFNNQQYWYVTAISPIK